MVVPLGSPAAAGYRPAAGISPGTSSARSCPVRSRSVRPTRPAFGRLSNKIENLLASSGLFDSVFQ